MFDPGPHQKPDSADWKPLSSDRLLDLKIADIACGSGAFLVAAARYLAARLVEAYHREGVATGTPHDLYTQAVRKVVANCLYGADINAMAVEMCKLSLWLVSLDPKLPFSFVDDKVLHGNSLLGLIDVRQLQCQHIDPAAANGQLDAALDIDVDGVLGQGSEPAAAPRHRGRRRRPAAVGHHEAAAVARSTRQLDRAACRTSRTVWSPPGCGSVGSRARHCARRTRTCRSPSARRTPAMGRAAEPHHARRHPRRRAYTDRADRLRALEAAALDHSPCRT